VIYSNDYVHNLIINPLGLDTSAFLDNVDKSAKVKKVLAIYKKVKNNKRSNGQRSKVVITYIKP